MGKTRLTAIQPWIKMWECEEMHVGRKGVSATDAWYSLAVDVGPARILNIPVVAGALDLFKRFDQILRALLYRILQVAGFPMGILSAYQSYHENVNLYTSFHGSIGTPHKHRCGIPQGCPLSMIFISIMLRPWILQMREVSLRPRTLADDLMLTTHICTSPTNTPTRCAQGFNFTIQDLVDLGGAKKQ